MIASWLPAPMVGENPVHVSWWMAFSDIHCQTLFLSLFHLRVEYLWCILSHMEVPYQHTLTSSLAACVLLKKKKKNEATKNLRKTPSKGRKDMITHPNLLAKCLLYHILHYIFYLPVLRVSSRVTKLLKWQSVPESSCSNTPMQTSFALHLC